jgi:hypothetical protein
VERERLDGDAEQRRVRLYSRGLNKTLARLTKSASDAASGAASARPLSGDIMDGIEYRFLGSRKGCLVKDNLRHQGAPPTKSISISTN